MLKPEQQAVVRKATEGIQALYNASNNSPLLGANLSSAIEKEQAAKGHNKA